MSGCNNCGRDCHGRYCDVCGPEKRAPDLTHEDDECPNCGADSPGGIRCSDCLPDGGAH